MEAVVVVDMGNEEVSNEKKFQNWFNLVYLFCVFVTNQENILAQISSSLDENYL